MFGAAVGIMDESIKILLPTREFDVIDLFKDWIGIGMSTFSIWIIKRMETK